MGRSLSERILNFHELGAEVKRTFPHRVGVATRDVDMAMMWCAEEFGPEGYLDGYDARGDWWELYADKRWCYTQGMNFRDISDAIMFKLRWANG